MDYVDVYGQAKSAGDQLWRYNYDARYCGMFVKGTLAKHTPIGTVSPRERISLYNVLMLVLHTRHNSEGERGFRGTFTFIEDCTLFSRFPFCILFIYSTIQRWRSCRRVA